MFMRFTDVDSSLALLCDYNIWSTLYQRIWSLFPAWLVVMKNVFDILIGVMVTKTKIKTNPKQKNVLS